MCIGFVVLALMFLFRIVAFVSLCIGLGRESQPMQEYVYWEKDLHDPDLWWKWSSKKGWQRWKEPATCLEILRKP